MSEKISDFTEQTAFADGDKIPVVRSSTNFKIDSDKLATYLGVTGTITPVPNADVDILDQPSGTLNNIRGLEGGKGTQVGLTAQNNVKVDHNFVNAAAGVGIIKDLTSAQTLFRSLLAGTGISVGISGDSIQISATAGTQSTKTVTVSQESDFPTASGGAITLDDDTDYLLLQDVTTSNRFIFGVPSVIRAADSSIASLTYTGSGNMFTGVDANFKLTKFKANCPSGTLFDVTGGIAQMIDMTVGECDEIGTFTDVIASQINNIAWDDIKTDGLKVFGNTNLFTLLLNLVTLNGGTFIDLGTSTSTGLNINGCFSILGAGTTFLDGAAASANINSGGLGVLDNNRFTGPGTALATITADDTLWNFANNDDIPDTRPDGLLSFQTPTTTNLAVATPALITGTWGVERSSQMTGTVAGRITYNGEKPVTLPISATLSIEPVSGTNKAVNIYLAKNGSVVSNSMVSTVVSAGGPKNQGVNWQDVFTENDFYELWIESVDGTDLQVNTASLRIN